jgi:hypothetical protein
MSTVECICNNRFRILDADPGSWEYITEKTENLIARRK